MSIIEAPVKIRSFTGLHTWQEGHKLVLMIYGITRKFPEEERFGLATQLQRACVSITSNIAEGFSKKSDREKRKFYHTSLASLTETQNQLLISRDIGLITPSIFTEVANQSVRVGKLINGLIKSANSV